MVNRGNKTLGRYLGQGLLASSFCAIGLSLLSTESKAVTLKDLKVQAIVNQPNSGGQFPEGSIIAGFAVFSWSAKISTLDEVAPINLKFTYSLLHIGKSRTDSKTYTFEPGLNLAPVGSGVLNLPEFEGPLSQGRYFTSALATLTSDSGVAGADADINGWRVGVVPEPLTLLGAGTALGFGTFFKRELSKKQKKEKAKV